MGEIKDIALSTPKLKIKISPTSWAVRRFKQGKRIKIVFRFLKDSEGSVGTRHAVSLPKTQPY